ncbi:DUF968 domain-containing protein [Photobacterium ganghwense]|uniref:DUF968 domain-containing protein n=1 Tax=Photobacterium ganghwense TaxID=320778 RepID=A0A0J1HAF1_9GAMM|nr:DUF968 domain-containing protein [Photobacterium ganghwense]KLV08651.1 hypothetical protein ABT57_12535 [Photobacterium ganghwense]PSU10771.1 DUF968 domain-containing protein [Photobacterium ganghwense]
MLVLQPFLQPDLGLMMFKPGKTLLSELAKMSQGNRLVVMPLPEELVNVPSGKLNSPVFPDNSKSLVEDERLLEFFTHPAVQNRLGNFYHWLERIPHCQLSDSEYCDKNLTFLDYASGAIRLCWHHDNQERINPTEKGRAIARRNVILWGLEAVKRKLRLDRAVSLPELCWWSVVNGVYECLPRSVVDEMFGLRPKPKSDTFTLRRESDERFDLDTKALLADRVKPIQFKIDDEPPAMYMARPKELIWRSEKYLKFVRSLPCVITGQTENVVAHHLIGHGEGKMGGKTHDLFTIPLEANEHRRFHDDPKAWEERHGSQLGYVKATLKRALELGALG